MLDLMMQKQLNKQARKLHDSLNDYRHNKNKKIEETMPPGLDVREIKPEIQYSSKNITIIYLIMMIKIFQQ